MHPLISVIIANYNYERYVSKAIDSVLLQTYPAVECIVVDDGSKDSSASVIRKYEKIIYIEKENGGQVSAILEGVRRAKGEIILFLDSDDFLYPQACRRIVDAYRAGVSIIQFRLDKVDVSGRKLGSFPDFPLLRAGHIEFLLKHGFIPSSPTSGNAFSGSHVRNMTATIDGTSEGKNWIDGYLIYSAIFAGQSVPLDEPLGGYLVHGDNASMVNGPSYKAVLNSVKSAVWQRKGYLRLLAADERDEFKIHQMALHNLAANHYRNALILRVGYREAEDLLPEFGKCDLALRACLGFLRFPFGGLTFKLYNICGVLAVLLAPAAVSRRLIPRTK